MGDENLGITCLFHHSVSDINIWLVGVRYRQWIQICPKSAPHIAYEKIKKVLLKTAVV